MAESKYTIDRVDRIITAIREGISHEGAANHGGIHKDTFYEWIKQYPDFSDAVKEAEAASELELVSKIKVDPSWQSKAWMLERRMPERWGRVDRLKQEISGPDGKPLVVKVLKGVSADDL